jgi:transposase
VSRADLAKIFAEWMGFDPRGISTGTMALSGTIRPGRVVLDSTLAESYGLHCRPLSETLRRHPVG